MNAYEERIAYELIYAGCEPEPGRFTNDIPINAEVWLAYRGVDFSKPRPLLLTPHLALGVSNLRRAVTKILPEVVHEGRLPSTRFRTEDISYVAANESHLLANISFLQLLKLLPLTTWWDKYIRSTLCVKGNSASQRTVGSVLRSTNFARWLNRQIAEHLEDERSLRQFKQIGFDATRWPQLRDLDSREQEAVRRLVNVTGLYVALTLLGRAGSMSNQAARDHIAESSRGVLKVLTACLEAESPSKDPNYPERLPLWAVAVNRNATRAVQSSRRTVKADAAIRVFDTGGHGIRWAVVDSGIDAKHPAFARLESLTDSSQLVKHEVSPEISRVVKTLDFTRFAEITSGRVSDSLVRKFLGRLTRAQLSGRIAEIERALTAGQMLDWAKLEPLLEVPHTRAYEVPADTHGTHVAGIIGSNWRTSTYKQLKGRPLAPPTELVDTTDVVGVCPKIELLDLRVFRSEADGPAEEGADEFAILAALQYVRYLNQSKDRQYVHGVNLSLSLKHDVRSYACGSTPVCLECDRLVGSGVVVVAAAGNYGYDMAYAETHLGGAYRGQSITDPGNTASVITVGSTHRSDPYMYGISYFSSHGPTGDGRNKPDLVAPGEKIMSTVPGVRLAPKDGTSMAAPHVSGVAALLLSRNRELMGHPLKVKEVLCQSATDLGRDKVFQGYGLVDALRALQAV